MEALKDRLTADYGLAHFRFGEHDTRAMVQEVIDGTAGIPILAMASGAIGTLRALHTRCGPIALDPGQALTLVAVKLVDGLPVAHTWVVRRPMND